MADENFHINRSEPVRTRPNRFDDFCILPNRKLDRRSGLPHVPNFEPDFGPVRKGSGSNHGSELNLAITTNQQEINDFEADNKVAKSYIILYTGSIVAHALDMRSQDAQKLWELLERSYGQPTTMTAFMKL